MEPRINHLDFLLILSNMFRSDTGGTGTLSRAEGQLDVGRSRDKLLENQM